MFSQFQQRRFLFLTLFGVLIFCQNIYPQGFVVDEAKIEVHISEKGYFDVVEKYDITFTEEKHGIYRDILTKYTLTDSEGNQEKRKIEIRNVEVPGHKFDSPFDFVQKMEDWFSIKIGDEKVTVIGPQHYEIRYRVYNAFLFEESQVQFYWNVKPDGWNADFNKLEFSIHPPENLDLDPDDFFVYSGERGTSKESDEFVVVLNNGVFTGKSVSGFNSKLGENVTVLLKLPKDSIAEYKPLFPFWTNYGWVIIIGGLLTAFYWVWNKFGKDDKVVATISYFPPKGIDSAMAGFLIDDRSDIQDLVSLIPSWGSRGLIKIEQIDKSGFFSKADTKLIWLKPLPEDAPDYEVKMFEGIFGGKVGLQKQEVLISSLKNTFYTTIKSASDKLKSEAQIYYDPKARKIKNQTIVGVILGSIILFVIIMFVWGFFQALALLPVAIFLLIMSPYLVKKNSKGNEALSDLKGFKQFVKVAEENRLKMLIQEDPSYFESTLAYALAFGMFNQWAKKFEALNVQPPNWYSSTSGVMTMNSFTNSFSSSMKSTQSSMISSPSSSGGSGGGSSGGGFGGGGGGSW